MLPRAQFLGTALPGDTIQEAIEAWTNLRKIEKKTACSPSGCFPINRYPINSSDLSDSQ
jgi:hypothetical protein